MYKHILIATDGSDLAMNGVTHGIELARSIGATVTVVTTTEPWSAFAMAHASRSGVDNPVIRFEQTAQDEAKEILDTAAKRAERIDLEVDTLHIPDRYPTDGIIETVQAKGCDLIVMASHGRRGASRLILGSQTAEVVARANVPVLVIR